MQFCWKIMANDVIRIAKLLISSLQTQPVLQFLSLLPLSLWISLAVYWCGSRSADYEALNYDHEYSCGASMSIPIS